MKNELLTNELLTNKVLHAELSYKFAGLCIEISQKYGYLHKEQIYQKALEELLKREKIFFVSQPRIDVCSLETGKAIGVYVPDLLIDNKIVAELKAERYLPKIHVNKLEQYLQTSIYEVGYIINFGSPKAEIIRRIYTNDRKPFVIHLKRYD